ncbi:hypothetical protein [Streptomyces xantholiticus]|uniref:hypothetical protein n=1 Tax=Streptomyces xantholiticus TaxID=68285 RepID=UPI0016770E50|nr:hypothetical protein [Streptomyces xantholiticus]
MNDSSENEAAESDDETLARLTSALGQPSLGVLERAKALFPFISDENHSLNADSVPDARVVPVNQVRG